MQQGVTMRSDNPRAEFTARYLIETVDSLERAAEVVAGEQSSGTFLSLPGETDELKKRSRARVLRVTELPSADAPTLRSALSERRQRPKAFRRGEIEIAFPVDNVGRNIPTLLATVAGNLFELGEITGLRLLDIDLPIEYAASFPGPKFGVDGTRRLAGVFDRPLIGTILKPSIGMSPSETASLVDKICEAGIDFLKDDELIADPPYAPFEERLRAVFPVIERHADRLGRKPMYAINISGSIDDMRRRHDLVLEAGGTCVMVSVNWCGFSAIEHLRTYTNLPIHGHRNGWGLFTRHPWLGFDFLAFQKLWRLTGVDHLHVNGLRSKFWEPDDSVILSASSCLATFSGVKPMMPVFSSGQWAGQAGDTFERLGSIDLMHLAGGGIMGHPGGIADGVMSLREAWQAAVQGIPAVEYAKSHAPLQLALSKFGGAP
ncbi:ribulose-bisphosphate carboxylase large subunit family protein [Bradyrhizobium yuanmingense]|nr:ribulose-bisphosphate carboxylase large subunit family protein [Bradyrhizobium yuanmingense]